MMNPRRSPAYRAPAVERAAQILGHLIDCPSPPSLTAIARALGYGKSTVHGLLQALESLGWVERRDGCFHVGKGFLRLARRAFGILEIAAVARPLMEQLAERVGENVFLGSRRGDAVVIQEIAEGRGEMRVASRPGANLPFMASALAKIFLAGVSPEEARSTITALGLPRFTARSIVDPAAFLVAVERTRDLGYAIDDEEYLRGVRAVAAPVQFRGRTVAALWIAGFSSRLEGDTLERAAAELVRTSQVVSRLLLGYADT